MARIDVATLDVEQIAVSGILSVHGPRWRGLGRPDRNGGTEPPRQDQRARSRAPASTSPSTPVTCGRSTADSGSRRSAPTCWAALIRRRNVSVFDVAGEPLDVLKVGDELWVTLRQAGEIAVIDPASGAIVDRFAVGASPHMMVEAFGSVWVTNAERQRGRPTRPGDARRGPAADPSRGGSRRDRRCRRPALRRQLERRFDRCPRARGVSEAIGRGELVDQAVSNVENRSSVPRSPQRSSHAARAVSLMPSANDHGTVTRTNGVTRTLSPACAAASRSRRRPARPGGRWPAHPDRGTPDAARRSTSPTPRYLARDPVGPQGPTSARRAIAGGAWAASEREAVGGQAPIREEESGTDGGDVVVLGEGEEVADEVAAGEADVGVDEQDELALCRLDGRVQRCDAGAVRAGRNRRATTRRHGSRRRPVTARGRRRSGRRTR